MLARLGRVEAVLCWLEPASDKSKPTHDCSKLDWSKFAGECAAITPSNPSIDLLAQLKRLQITVACRRARFSQRPS